MATKKKDSNIVTGKRKRAVARAIVKNGDGKFVVNGKTPLEYFGPNERINKKMNIALELTGNIGKKDIFVTVSGGGKFGQADAICHAVSLALAAQKETNRKNLKTAGLVSRDARIKESKKYGRKKARKRFQFSKR